MRLQPNTNFFTVRNYPVLITVSVGVGMALRLYFYFLNRSLWMDEVYLSSGILNMSLRDLLTQPLPYFQKAPLGFLLMQKLFITLLPANEMSLRLFPLLCGTAALLVFIKVAKYFLSGNLVGLAVGLFALAPPIVYHAVEAKQYATELLAALVALWLYTRYNRAATNKQLLIWAVTGAVLTWFSYAVIFVLSAIAIVITISRLLHKDWPAIRSYMAVFLFWLLSFGINYFLSTYKHAESGWTRYWFDQYKNFAPLFPSNIEDLKWYPINIYRLLNYPLGLLWNFKIAGYTPLLKMAFIPLTMLAAGIFYGRKKKQDVWVLLITIGLTLVASGLKLYPLTERFWLFIAPVFIILIVKGCEGLNERFVPGKFQWLLPLLLLIGPFINAIGFVQHPQNFIMHKRSFQKEAMNYIASNFRAGDVVYIYWNDNAGYKLYKQLYNYTFPALEGKDYRRQSNSYPEYFALLNNEWEALKTYKRIWLVMNDYYQSDIGEPIDSPAWYFRKDARPTERVLGEFLKKGKIAATYKSFDVLAYCIELNH